MNYMSGLPVNTLGEVVVSAGEGTSSISGSIPPDSTPVDALGRMIVTPFDEFYLDIQSRESTTLVPTTPTTYKWSTLVTGLPSSYDTSTGVVSIPFTGMYSLCISYNVSASSGTRRLLSAGEVYDGTSWVKIQYSARQQPVRSVDTSQVMFISTNRFVKGQQIRFVTWCDAAVSVTTENAVGSTGFTIPASRLLITGIRSL